MESWTDLFGKQSRRNNPSSHVRTRYHCESGSKRGVLTFVFSDEILEMMGWKAGDLLDLRGDGKRLIVVPSPTGRTLRSDRYVEWAIDNSDISRANKLFGFDVKQPQFWEKYTPDGDQLILLLQDMGVPDEAE